MKSVRVRNYFGSYFPALGLNTDQNNSEYGQFLRSDRNPNDFSETLINQLETFYSPFQREICSSIKKSQNVMNMIDCKILFCFLCLY